MLGFIGTLNTNEQFTHVCAVLHVYTHYTPMYELVVCSPLRLEGESLSAGPILLPASTAGAGLS